jgi:L-lactate dehydrogenase complex protein LldF
MGEFIVQLREEKPSHIIMPAIHLNAGQVASLFHDKLDVDYTEDVDRLIQIGRETLRRKFFEADIGVSGVNFAIAETGTLLLVENEGNGRMSTTVPPVHIAVTGIEKVVENLRDVVPLLSLLTRSATGQPITTYVNMISGPRKADELDGPREVHLVLLDNGPQPGLCGRRAAPDAELHPLRRMHEPLPGVHADRRPRLRHRLSGADWQDRHAAHARP